MSFEQANVVLENVLLAELAGGVASGADISANLQRSLSEIGDMRVHITALDQKMDDLHFVDLPSIRSIDFDDLGAKMVSAGMVEAASWDEVMTLTRAGGFRSVLNAIAAKRAALECRTMTLLEQVSALDAACAVGQVHEVVEENRPGNIKVAFAQLYNEWARFQQFFLASSMSSTEQWYAFMGYGSLVSQSGVATKRQPVATVS